MGDWILLGALLLFTLLLVGPNRLGWTVLAVLAAIVILWGIADQSSADSKRDCLERQRTDSTVECVSDPPGYRQ